MCFKLVCRDMLRSMVTKFAISFAFEIGLVATYAGSIQSFADGFGTAVCFNNPRGIAINSIGVVFIADSSNNRIRMIATSG